MRHERHGGVTIKGSPLTVYGRQLEVGEKAPEFQVTAPGFEPVTLADSAGTVRLISVVPSLDTGICDAQTRRFNEEASTLGDDVTILTISAEHPFNQKRWCGAAGVDNIAVLSDHRDLSFGHAYGTAIKEWRLNQRAIFVINDADEIVYREYVPEIAQHPDYENALAAAREAAG